MAATILQQLSPSHSAGIKRAVFGLVFGGLVTLGLLWTMQSLIDRADRTLDEGTAGHLLDFVRLKRAEVITRRETKPKKPPTPDNPPPQPPTPRLDNLNPSAEKIAISAAPVSTDIDLSGGGFSLGIGEGDYLPIVKVAPIYPQRALSRGVEGFCVVEYTVTKLGTIRDPVVIESQCSSSLFHRASLQAAAKFKYKPRVMDGEAIDVPGVRNQFTYEITK
jgi:protein TonB